MDSYIDNQRMPETNVEMLNHFRTCVACSREVEAMRAMRERVRSAARTVEAPPWLEGRVRARLRAPASRNWGSKMWAPVAAMLLFAAGVGVAYQDLYIASISMRVASIMRVGLSDHVHCAVFRKYGAAPPSTAKLEADLGPEYRGLLAAVRDRVPAGFQPWIAHSCAYRGRPVVHVTFRGNGRLFSLTLARKLEGESFASEGLPPVGDLPMYRAGVQRFSIAAFETRAFLVYAISDMPAQSNMDVMAALAPSVRAYLDGLHG
jgi:hypothetical protein